MHIYLYNSLTAQQGTPDNPCVHDNSAGNQAKATKLGTNFGTGAYHVTCSCNQKVVTIKKSHCFRDMAIKI